MNYSKPEVKTLGQATAVIEKIGKASPVFSDPPTNLTNHPAYDLDE